MLQPRRICRTRVSRMAAGSLQQVSVSVVSRAAGAVRCQARQIAREEAPGVAPSGIGTASRCWPSSRSPAMTTPIQSRQWRGGNCHETTAAASRGQPHTAQAIVHASIAQARSSFPSSESEAATHLPAARLLAATPLLQHVAAPPPASPMRSRMPLQLRSMPLFFYETFRAVCAYRGLAQPALIVYGMIYCVNGDGAVPVCAWPGVSGVQESQAVRMHKGRLI